MAEKRIPKACKTARILTEQIYCKGQAIENQVLYATYIKHLETCVSCAKHLNLIREEWVVETKQ